MPSIDLPPREIQLWTVFHRLADVRHREMELHLTPDEIVLRERFGEERARKFTTTRATLRVLLSRYTGIPPREVRFRYGPRGKPFLVERGREDNPRIQFNLSDSADVVVFGFASDREIGVDIERVRHVERWESIARRFFGEEAAAELAKHPQPECDNRFIARWVMEEARIKATGQGLWSRGSPESARLTYAPFTPAEGYQGAVAAPGSDWTIASSGAPG